MEIDETEGNAMSLRCLRKQIENIEEDDKFHKIPSKIIITPPPNISEIEQLKVENQKLKTENLALKYKLETMLFRENNTNKDEVFHDAILNEDIDMLNKFLINMPSKFDKREFNFAIENEKMKSIEFFADIGIEFSDFNTFSNAIVNKQYAVVNYLWDKFPEFRKDFEWTVINNLYCSNYTEDTMIEMLKFLCIHNISIEQIKLEFFSSGNPFDFAIKKEYDKIIEFLCENTKLVCTVAELCNCVRHLTNEFCVFNEFHFDSKSDYAIEMFPRYEKQIKIINYIKDKMPIVFAEYLRDNRKEFDEMNALYLNLGQKIQS